MAMPGQPTGLRLMPLPASAAQVFDSPIAQSGNVAITPR